MTRSYDVNSMDSDLFGHDVGAGDQRQPVEVTIEVGCRQFVNRWVFLAHQRPAALAELTELIAEARK